ncbi:MAG: DHH family phosphoesterase [Candidatus Cloacimonetes bacterium]|nr:DHH family phosphoesterase [Candidatus Cloacimonadota bacterium]
MIVANKAIEFGSRMLSEIQTAKKVCLTTHIHPDGDGLCACLAVKRIFRHLGVDADFVVDDLNLDRYAFLQVYDNVKAFDKDMQYDLVFVIDLHDYQRMGERLQLVKTADKVFVLDHHEIEDDMMDCAANWVDSDAVCSGWMLYEMFKAEISKMAAEDKVYVGNCLYTTLLNDTNNFTNANTDANAYDLAKAVCEYGVKSYQIHRKYMDTRTPPEMRFIGQMLSTLETYEQGTILFMDSTLAMLKENNLDNDATSNMSRWVQDLKGIETIAYFREEAPEVYKLSLRSKIKNVHSIAVKYGGGGHIRASGCSFKGSLNEAKKVMLSEILNAEKLPS